LPVNEEPDFRYGRPDGAGWWLLWVVALLGNLLVVTWLAGVILGLIANILSSPSDWGWESLGILMVVVPVFTASALVLLLMGADEGKTAYWLHRLALITNVLIAITIFVGILFGAWPLLILLLYPGLNLLLILSSRRLVRQGLCPSCLYNLTGNTSGRCPECGTTI